MLNFDIETPVGKLTAMWSAKGLLQSCSFTTSRNGGGDASPIVSEWEPHPMRIDDEDDDVGEDDDDDEIGDQVVRQTHRLLQRSFTQYFETGMLRWDLALLDWSGVSSFHRSVLRQCYEIPSGERRSYGQLAVRAGNAKAARAVGGAMARNRWPILIPCHRVVGRDGRLTGYSGAGGLDTKQRLLDWESGELQWVPSQKRAEALSRA